MPAFTALCMAASNEVPGGDPPSERLMTLAPASRAESIPWAMAPSKKSQPPSFDLSAHVPGASARKDNDRRVERDSDILQIIARSSSGRGHGGAVSILIAQSATSGDVAAGGVDPASEFSQRRVDPAVDHGKLHPCASSATLPGGDSARADRTVRSLILRRAEIGPRRGRGRRSWSWSWSWRRGGRGHRGWSGAHSPAPAAAAAGRQSEHQRAGCRCQIPLIYR